MTINIPPAMNRFLKLRHSTAYAHNPTKGTAMALRVPEINNPQVEVRAASQNRYFIQRVLTKKPEIPNTTKESPIVIPKFAASDRKEK